MIKISNPVDDLLHRRLTLPLVPAYHLLHALLALQYLDELDRRQLALSQEVLD